MSAIGIIGGAQRRSPLAGLTAPAAPRGIRRYRDAGDASLLNSFSFAEPRPIINSCDKVPHMSVIGIVAVSKPPSAPPTFIPLDQSYPTQYSLSCRQDRRMKIEST